MGSSDLARIVFLFVVQWSFGVTCWEVFSLGKNPYPGVDPFSLIRYLERGERLDKPLNAACSQEMLVAYAISLPNHCLHEHVVMRL